MTRRSTMQSMTTCLTALATGLLTVACSAQGPKAEMDAPEAVIPETLRIGDDAADLAPEILWLRNILVPEFLDGTVYVLYLWSTDSPGSMGSFPQLHGLDQRFRDKGVVTISVAIDVQEGGFEPIDVIKSRAEFMAHTVAEDRGTYIKDNWYTPTGFETLPVVFVINQEGVIASMDNKMAKVEKNVTAVLEGTHDINHAIAEFDRVRDLEKRVEPLIEEATLAARQGNWSHVIVCADRLLEEDKVHYSQMAMTKFMLYLTKLSKPGIAYEWGYKIINDHIKNDSPMLVTMAETILFSPGIPYRDYNLARKAAERADILTDGKLAQVKNALAGAWMGLGETGKAIEFQMEAVRLAPTADAKGIYQESLDQLLNQLPSP